MIKSDLLTQVLQINAIGLLQRFIAIERCQQCLLYLRHKLHIALLDGELQTKTVIHLHMDRIRRLYLMLEINIISLSVLHHIDHTERLEIKGFILQ